MIETIKGHLLCGNPTCVLGTQHYDYYPNKPEMNPKMCPYCLSKFEVFLTE